MKHKVYRIIILLLALCVLSGCGTTQAPETTPPATTEATEPTATTAPPTEPSAPAMDAEDLYWKMRFAAGNNGITEYTTVETMNLRVGSAGVYLRTNMTNTTRVIRSSQTHAVNVETELYYTSMDLEVEQKSHSYYRMEGRDLICYTYFDTLDIWEQQVLEGPAYEVLQRFNFSAYPNQLPDDLVLAEQTQMVGDREAYVLTHYLSGEEYYGFFDDPEIDAEIAEIEIPVTTYVDTETYKPLKIDYSMEDIGEVMSAMLYSAAGGFVDSTMGEVVVEIKEYTITTTDLNFEIVDVPDIPEEGMGEAQQSSGYQTV